MNEIASPADFGRPLIGSQPSILTFADIVGRDAGRPITQMAAFGTEGTYRAPKQTIPFSRYSDPEIAAAEVERIWKRCWTVACREEDIPKVGDRVVYDVAGLSFIISRCGPDEIKAFYNFCPHRGRALCDGNGSGAMQCPFHGWTWAADGSLQWVPAKSEFPHVDAAHYSLQEVSVGRWGGQVFINPDIEAPPLEESLGVLMEHFSDCSLEDRYTAACARIKIRCNWKLAQEAFNEAYHMLETHWDALSFSGDTAAHIECWDDGVSHVDRLSTPMVVPSGFMTAKVSSRDALNAYLMTLDPALDLASVPEEMTDSGQARKFVADRRREELRPVLGDVVDTWPASYLLDGLKYFQYPNFHPWLGMGVPLFYRFYPTSVRPDECIMEIRFLLPVPPGEPRPKAAEPICIEPGQRIAEIPSLGFLGPIIDQDLANLERIQDGMAYAPPERAYLTLAREAETIITHFHQVYAHEMDLAPGK